MANADDESVVAAALDSLRKHRQFFEFDDKEHIVKVCISEASNADELAAHVGNLRDLEKVRFSRTDLTNDGLRHLSGLVRLKELCIDGIDRSTITSAGLAHLSAMPQLEYLYIEDARGLDLAAFTCIAHVPSLRKLTLCGGRFSDADLEPLAALVNLEELSLSECNRLDGTFCNELIGLPRLRDLSFGEEDGHVTDEGLASIAKLSYLDDLSVTGQFTDAGLRHLVALQRLSSLFVQSENVTAESVSVVARLPKLNSLHLDTPKLMDDCVSDLLHCSALETMVFRRSAISDAGLRKLRADLPNCLVRDWQRDANEFGPRAETKDTVGLRFENTTPFSTLLAQAGDWDLVNGTFHKIGERYHHWVDATQYSAEERVIMLVWHSSGIIGNGGFEYLFAGEFPGDPDYRITAEAYQTAGLLRGYEAFQEAFALFPGGKVPHDRTERDQLYQAANHSARYRLNRKLWQDEYDATCEKRLAEFIRAIAARLGDLDAAP
jgi:hypothetical protein